MTIPKEKGRHCFIAEYNGRKAPLPAHRGDKSPVAEKDLRCWCSKLRIDLDKVKRRLAGERVPDLEIEEDDASDSDSGQPPEVFH